MRINSIDVKSSLTGNNRQKNVKFTGELIVLKTVQSIPHVNEIKYIKNLESEMNWLNWISKSLRHYTKHGNRITDSTKSLFTTVNESFISIENKNFLDKLFRESPEDAKLYKKKFQQVVNQFRGAGVHSKDCEDLKGSLDFIEEISAYKFSDDLLAKKYNWLS